MSYAKRFGLLSWIILIGGVEFIFAQMTPEKTTAKGWIQDNEAKAKEVNQRIWNLAELGLTDGGGQPNVGSSFRASLVLLARRQAPRH